MPLRESRLLDIAYIGRIPPFRGGITARLARALGTRDAGPSHPGGGPDFPEVADGARPGLVAAAHPNIDIVRGLAPGYDTVGTHSVGLDEDRRLQRIAVQRCLSAW